MESDQYRPISDKPILVFESAKGKSSAWFGQNVERDRTETPAQTIIAKLGYDWRSIGTEGVITKPEEIQKNTRLIAFNKAPTVFTQEEAKEFFGLEPSDEEQGQSSFLSGNKTACDTIVRVIKTNERAWPAGEELEQKIYDGFPSKEDEKLAASFRNSKSQDRARIAREFRELKYRQLALRLLYLEKKEVLTVDEESEIKGMICNRFNPATDKEYPWRSLNDAIKELTEPRAIELGSDEELAEIKEWLTKRLSTIA